MGRLRWYKRDPAAALEGMSDLTLEERGAYNTVLDLIYARDGAVDDDDRFIAGWLRCDVRVWRRIRARLLDLGKLYIRDGVLRNSRADAEVDRGLSMVASAQEAGKASARKRRSEDNKNNDIAPTNVEATVSTNSTTTTTSRKNSSLRSLEHSDDWPPDFRDRFWQRYPRKIGKAAAVRKLETLRRAGSLRFDALMAAVERYAVAASGIELRFVKHPATWLNAGCWEDDPAALARAGPSSGQQENLRIFAARMRNANAAAQDQPQSASTGEAWPVIDGELDFSCGSGGLRERPGGG